MAKRWYVVHAYSGYEKHVMRSLVERVKLAGMEDGFGEILVPTEEVVEMRNGQPKGSDCKSDVYDFEGSNPSPSTRFSASCKLRGYSLVVEPQPSKLMMRVRFPLPAPCLQLMQIVLLL